MARPELVAATGQPTNPFEALLTTRERETILDGLQGEFGSKGAGYFDEATRFLTYVGKTGDTDVMAWETMDEGWHAILDGLKGDRYRKVCEGAFGFVVEHLELGVDTMVKQGRATPNVVVERMAALSSPTSQFVRRTGAVLLGNPGPTALCGPGASVAPEMAS